MQKQHVTLNDQDRASLNELLSQANLSARTRKRATALLVLDQGQTLLTVAEQLGVTDSTVGVWREKYHEAGLSFLHDAPRSGRPAQLTAEVRAQIVALAQGPPPEGRTRWSLRLLASKIAEAGICASISARHVSNILKQEAS